MKTLPLKGFKSLRAMNAFHALMLGLKMLPAYMGESYEEFFGRVSLMDPADQEKLIREATLFVELQKEEVEALASFCLDPNGVPYSAENMKSAPAELIFEMIVLVCKEIAKIRIDIVGDGQKKNSNPSA